MISDDTVILLDDSDDTSDKRSIRRNEQHLDEADTSALREQIAFLTEQVRAQNKEIREKMRKNREQQQEIASQQYRLQEQSEQLYIRNLELERQQEILTEQAREIELVNTRLEENNIALAEEQARSNTLLLNILPASIMKRLQNGETLIADSFPDVTVLFADIVGFTQMSAERDPADLVQMLNWIFSIFDGLTEHFGLEKIKTIGDAYMAASGIPTARADHAEAAATMALAIVRETQALCEQLRFDVQVRVGLHSGPVIAGVIGRKKFIYDLWGDTVNIASRMESHGEPGAIHCTEQFVDKLRNRFVFQPRGSMDIKGKGLLRTYFLVGRTNDQG
jgi:adenylate cyclase